MKLRRFDIIKLMLISSVLLPGIQIPGLFLMRPEEILAFVLLPIVLIKFSKQLTWIDISFILIGVSTFISMVWGTWALGMPISPRDLMEFVKIIKAWTLFRLALAPWSDRQLVSMANTWLACVSIAAVVGIIEWQNLFGLRAAFQGIYVANKVHAGTWRMIGTVGNPNYYGLLLVVGIVLAINMWNYNQRRAWRRRAIIVFGLCSLALSLTYSRSAILAVLLAIVSLLLIRIPRLRYKAAWRALTRVRWQALIITILVIAALVWAWNQFQIIATLTTPAELVSYWQNPVRRALYRLTAFDIERAFDVRVEKMWKPNFPLIMQSPVFGWGAGKEEHKTVTDNGYLLTLRRYGLVGLLCLLSLYGQVIRALLKVCRRNRINPGEAIHQRLAMTAFGVIVGYIGANFFVELFYHLQLMSWLWLLVGICVSPVFHPLYFPASNSGLPNKTIEVSVIGSVP